MAIANLLVKGSYSKIKTVWINLTERVVRILLDVYKDETKDQLITTMDYTIGYESFTGMVIATDETLSKYKEDFDSLFGSEALSKEGCNIYQAVYDYLKSREELKNTKNA